MIPWPRSADAPAASEASPVLRQNRSLPSAAVTVRGAEMSLTMYMVPVSAFSGSCPPSDASANRGSRQVPVHSEVDESILPPPRFWELPQVSLYETSVR